MSRFSKSNLILDLETRVTIIQKYHHFDEGDGYAQVLKSDMDRQQAYAKFRTLKNLIDELNANEIGYRL